MEGKLRALITGATGFLGANIVEAVVDCGWEARAMRRRGSSLKGLHGLTYQEVEGDVLDPASLRRAMEGVDFVFHVAGVADYWRSSEERLLSVNVEGTENVLLAAMQQGVRRVVFTSSVAALGCPDFGSLLDERAEFNLSPSEFMYGYSKVLAENVVSDFVSKGLDVVTVNPAVVVGPRDVYRGSGSLVIHLSKFGVPFYPVGGMCVIDAAEASVAHIAAAQRGRTGERYILGGQNLWHREILTILAGVVGRRPPSFRVDPLLARAGARALDFFHSHFRAGATVSGTPLRFSNETFWFDSGKAQRELGLKVRPYGESAESAFRWYNDNGYL